MIAVSDAKLSAGLSLLAALTITVASFRPWFVTGWGSENVSHRWPKFVLAGVVLLLLGSLYFLLRSDG